ncbi:hypothetical protein [Thiorhodospira sibirica]|uniref:hypothetical protein n=1 Tax=Thiorhodospira sibirica TaxID=154347 RepID=UPI001112620D|nr:hypothetical protein [Thiorhodospira sibirica]
MDADLSGRARCARIIPCNIPAEPVSFLLPKGFGIAHKYQDLCRHPLSFSLQMHVFKVKIEISQAVDKYTPKY